MERIPLDALVHTFSFLPLELVIPLRLVKGSWGDAATSDTLWSQRYPNHNSTSSVSAFDQMIDRCKSRHERRLKAKASRAQRFRPVVCGEVLEDGHDFIMPSTIRNFWLTAQRPASYCKLVALMGLSESGTNRLIWDLKPPLNSNVDTCFANIPDKCVYGRQIGNWMTLGSIILGLETKLSVKRPVEMSDVVAFSLRCHGIIFMVNGRDRERLVKEAAPKFRTLMTGLNAQSHRAPVLVLCTEQEDDSMSPLEIGCELDIGDLARGPWCLQGCDVCEFEKNPRGLREGLLWLDKTMRDMA